jgi:phosphatidylserine decarboxylase
MAAVRLPRGVERALAAAVSSPVLSRLTGRLADLRLPRGVLVPLLRAYVRHFGVALEEAAEPLEAHRTFNSFFTRRLKDGVRPVAEGPRLVVSPSDSRLVAMGSLPGSGRIEQVKGSDYAVAALLGSDEEAEAFRSGVFATLYLSPGMYHRVHSPVRGQIRRFSHIPGRLFPVNPLAVRSVPGLFAANERVAIFIDSSDVGRLALVLVGAANVGRIGLAFADFETNQGRRGVGPPPVGSMPVRRGQELAVFNLGSTVVLLVADETLGAAGLGPGELVRVGQPLFFPGPGGRATGGGFG